MATFPISGTIAGVSGAGRFTVFDDHTATFTPGTQFSVTGSQGGITDGIWTVLVSFTSATFGSPDTETRIEVTATIPTQGAPFGNIDVPPLVGGSPIPSGSPVGSPLPAGSPLPGGSPVGSPLPSGSPSSGSPSTGSPIFSGSPINTGSPIGDDEMFLINHDYTVGDTVHYIEDGAVKTGTVLKVEITVLSTGTTINYILQVGTDSVTIEESLLYGNCRAEGGYQDIVFTAALSSSTVVIPVGSTLAGSTLTGSVSVDGGTPVALSYLVAGLGSPFLVDTAVSVQDILTDLNGVLNPLADAFIYQNNIRIRSRTTGPSSTVLIEDGTGSPLADKYFANLENFTGLAAPVVGLGDGAIEGLGNQICT